MLPFGCFCFHNDMSQYFPPFLYFLREIFIDIDSATLSFFLVFRTFILSPYERNLIIIGLGFDVYPVFLPNWCTCTILIFSAFSIFSKYTRNVPIYIYPLNYQVVPPCMWFKLYNPVLQFAQVTVKLSIFKIHWDRPALC